MGVRLQLQGFPYRQILVMSLIRFSEPIGYTSLFPYMYFMIRDFKIAPTEKDIPKYSGYLASCFAFFQFVFAVRWGKLSDSYGRKPILLIGLAGSSVTLVLFGFAPNYWVALFARSLAGCLNGNVAVLRTVVGEIVTEKRHQALAFLMLPLIFNFGSIIGPAIGGSVWLTRPQKKSPYDVETLFSALQEKSELLTSLGAFYESFITKYPYALSNIVVGFFLWFSLICGFLFLEETHPVLKYKRDIGLDIGDKILTFVGISTPEREWNRSWSGPNEETLLLDSSSDNEDLAKADVDYSGAFTPQVATVITSNFIVSLHSIAYNQFLPVLLALTYNPDNKFPWKISGGLGWSLGQIGTLLSSTGMVGIGIILIIFPFMDAKLGTILGYRASVSLFPFVYFITPWIIFTLTDYNPNIPTWVNPAVMYLLNSLKTLGTATGLSQIMILCHRAALPEHRAYVNSSTMSITALARFVGPVVFGYLMSFGEDHEIGWLIWWMMALLAVGGMVQSFYIVELED